MHDHHQGNDCTAPQPDRSAPSERWEHTNTEGLRSHFFYILPFSSSLSCDPLGESDHAKPRIPPSKKTRIVLSDRLVRRPTDTLATDMIQNNSPQSLHRFAFPRRLPPRSYSCSNNVPQVHWEHDWTSQFLLHATGSTLVDRIALMASTRETEYMVAAPPPSGRSTRPPTLALDEESERPC